MPVTLPAPYNSFEVVPTCRGVAVLVVAPRITGTRVKVDISTGDFSAPLADVTFTTGDVRRCMVKPSTPLTQNTDYKLRVLLRDMAGTWGSAIDTTFRTLNLYPLGYLRAIDSSGNARHGTYGILQNQGDGTTLYLTSTGPDVRNPALQGNGYCARLYHNGPRTEGYIVAWQNPSGGGSMGYGTILGGAAWSAAVLIDPSEAVDSSSYPLVGYDKWRLIVVPGVGGALPTVKFWFAYSIFNPVHQSRADGTFELTLQVPSTGVQRVEVGCDFSQLGNGDWNSLAYICCNGSRSEYYLDLNQAEGEYATLWWNYYGFSVGGSRYGDTYTGRVQHAAYWNRLLTASERSAQENALGNSADYMAALTASAPDVWYKLDEPWGPDRPTVTVTQDGTTAHLLGSAYSDPDDPVQPAATPHGPDQIARHWLVFDASGTASLDTVDTTNLTNRDTTWGAYSVRVRDRDKWLVFGPWSNVVPFTAPVATGRTLKHPIFPTPPKFYDEEDERQFRFLLTLALDGTPVPVPVARYARENEAALRAVVELFTSSWSDYKAPEPQPKYSQAAESSFRRELERTL